MARHWLILVPVALGLLLAACGSPAPGTPSVQVSVSPANLSVAAGTQSTFTVTATPQGGFSGSVEAAVAFTPDAPGIVVGPLTPWSISGSAPQTRTFTVAVASDVEPGPYQATVTFRLDGSQVGSVQVAVTVLPEGEEPGPGPGPSEAPRLAVGNDFVLVIASDGTVWAWGDNYFGQLGSPEHEDPQPQATPVEGLPADAEVLTVAASEVAAYALMDDGTLWSWGSSDMGQLGRWYVGGGTYEAGPVEINNSEPPEVPVEDFVGVAVGGESAMAWREDGSVWAWGANYSGQLGNATSLTSDTPRPALVSLQEAGVAAIGLGARHGVAATASGEVWAWGGAFEGQLGTGDTYMPGYFVMVPVKVAIDAQATAVAAGSFHSLALLADGTLWSWGMTASGRLGHGGDGKGPGQVGLPEGAVVTQIDAGNAHSLALLDDGTVLAWGENEYGQLGNGEFLDSTVPVEVVLPEPATFIAAGYRFSVAVLADGSVWAWGENWAGQRGDADFDGFPEPPVPVQVVPGWED